jgi:hypothetical protein
MVVGPLVLILLVLGVGVGGWLVAMSMDKSRITAYVEERGGRVVSISWAPFGKGWFGDKNDRIYEVVYYDAEGRQHFATCKTSLFSGVYWTDDRVSHARPQWYDRAPRHNEAGNPVIRHLPEADRQAEDEAAEALGLGESPKPRTSDIIDKEAAQALGVPAARRPTDEAIDAEIARLRQRIAELERQKRNRDAYRAEPQ